MSNERITENLVRDILKEKGYYVDDSLVIEEQKSQNVKIDKCLKNASKTGGSGSGRPEFIVWSTNERDFVLVIECKAQSKYHQSDTLDKYRDYAVDGALNYASYLSTDFNVIAIAVSGQEDLKISTYLWIKNAKNAKPLEDRNGNMVESIEPFDKYIHYATYDYELEHKRYTDLISFSKDLHNYMRDYAKLSETEKPLLVSGILIALSNNAFRKNYKDYEYKELPHELFEAIQREINKAKIPNAKKQNMLHPYSFIAIHPALSKLDKKTKESPLFRLVDDIYNQAQPFINVYHNFDVIGQFYGEFLKYTGGDKKGLGIVLTPKHITTLFAKMANLTVDSVVLDTCCGTAGFLIASMIEILKQAKTEDEISRIKSQNLLGIEQQPNMFALAASNMILRGDGKANLYQGSCFDEAITKEIISKKATVGMINPPYSQKGEGLKEFDFIYHMLNCLDKNATGIAIVPISCAVGDDPMKEKILADHTLLAVMSMPDELFNPNVSAVTCIMVFKAKVPHSLNPHHKTWFGYWKDDGFVKTKHQGRIDLYNRWNKIEAKWLEAYFNKLEIPGLSVLKKVEPYDEWCAEAYMETDYSNIHAQDFEREMKKYLSFQILNGDDV